MYFWEERFSMPEVRRYGFLSVKEAAAQLNREQDFVYRELARRSLAHHKIGGRLFISQRDLDDYVASRRVRPLNERKNVK